MTTIVPPAIKKLIDAATKQSIKLAPEVFLLSGKHITMLNVIKKDGFHLVEMSLQDINERDAVESSARAFCADAFAVVLICEQWERFINVENEEVRQQIERTGVVPPELLKNVPATESLIVQIERLDEPKVRRVSWQIQRDASGNPSLVFRGDDLFDSSEHTNMLFLKHEWN